VILVVEKYTRKGAIHLGVTEKSGVITVKWQLYNIF
jgi:hypothetical protein